MNNIIKAVLLLIIICCSITACGPSTRNSLITKTTPIPQANKTMVIFNNLDDQLWARLDDKYGKKDELLYSFRGTFSKGIYGSYHIHMLEPGTYALERLYFNYVSYGIDFNHLGQYKLLSFVAKPGEVIYIGDIRFYNSPTERLFSYEFKAEVKDEFAAAKAYLAKERPDVNPNLLKKELVTIKPEVLKK